MSRARSVARMHACSHEWILHLSDLFIGLPTLFEVVTTFIEASSTLARQGVRYIRICLFCCGRRSCESADATVAAGLGRRSIREYDSGASADSMVAAGQAAERAIVTITPAAKAITTDERSRCSMPAPTRRFSSASLEMVFSKYCDMICASASVKTTGAVRICRGLHARSIDQVETHPCDIKLAVDVVNTLCGTHAEPCTGNWSYVPD